MKLFHSFLGFIFIWTALINSISVQGQNDVVTYQGRVLDNGTNFSGTGQFQFALVTSSNANLTATAVANTPSGGYITSYRLITSGSGYTSAPMVTVTGGQGAGATAQATISGGVVTGISVVSTGNGQYTNTPLVTLSAPPANLSYITYWSNDGTSTNGSEPSAVISLLVSNGLFTLGLGDTTLPGMISLPASLFQQQTNLQLRIWFNDGTNGFAALSPLQNLNVTPYSGFASFAGGVTGALTVQQNGNGAPNIIEGSTANNVSTGIFGATIAGGGSTIYYLPNLVYDNFGTVSGGYNNIAGGFASTISGGANNSTISINSTIGGGLDNIANGFDTTIAGGFENIASSNYAVVGGGFANVASGVQSVVSGGYNNNASGSTSVVGGGNDNLASGVSAVVVGGNANIASGSDSFAAGTAAQALHLGAFVWADESSSSFPTFASTGTNQFLIRAHGGVGINTSTPNNFYDLTLNGGIVIDNSSTDNGTFSNTLAFGNNSGEGIGSVRIATNGDAYGLNFYTDFYKRLVILNNGNVGIGTTNATNVLTVSGNTAVIGSLYASSKVYAGGVQLSSDRNLKENFAPINPSAMLDKVAALPVSRWNYISDGQNEQHVGPMAQDFHAAFGLDGVDDKHISVVDEGGVALAAIQGLNQKLENRSSKLERENAELQSRLTRLEEIIQKLKRTDESNKQ